MVMSEQTNALIDIVEPAVPVAEASGGWLWLALAVVVVLALLFAARILWKYKLPGYRAVQHLRKLQQQLKAKTHTPHESALMLALELRKFIHVTMRAGPCLCSSWMMCFTSMHQT
jgi:hypothetical protein